MVTEPPSDFSLSTGPGASSPGRRASDAVMAGSGHVSHTSRWGTLFRWFAAGMLVLACILSLGLAWKAQRQVSVLQQELVRRQEASQNQAAEAHLFSKQAQDSGREAVAKVALLEARVAEVAIQRTQLEELIQSLSRSRDENMVVDIEAAIRVALQQAAITGSAEPLVAVLKQSDERLARHNQPRLQGIRRAILRDLDRVRAVGGTDVGMLTIRLDEAVRLVDELPLLSARAETSAEGVSATSAVSVPASSSVSGAAGAGGESAASPWWIAAQALMRRVWQSASSLVRVSRIDHPEAMLLSPDQAFFLRENLKLRLLNARLALLSRQFDTAQTDLAVVQNAVQRYFDPNASRRTGHVMEVVRQVAAQSRSVAVPRPDDTLAALSAVEGGR